MSTPSSGPISWSQIQSVTGGAYSMSHFNAVSGRGYSASNYYNYNPVTCYSYQANDYGWADGVDCYGNYFSYYINPWDGFCAQWMSGPVYWTGNYCLV